MPVAKTTNKTAPKPAPEIDAANYISEKLGNILENIGSQYGVSLQDELLNRLERTIAEFDNEVNEMLVELKQRSLTRREQLQNMIQHQESETEIVEEEPAEEETEEPAREMSEWERRLEMLEQKKS